MPPAGNGRSGLARMRTVNLEATDKAQSVQQTPGRISTDPELGPTSLCSGLVTHICRTAMYLMCAEVRSADFNLLSLGGTI